MDGIATTDRRDLAFAGVARQAELVRAGEISPRELVETALERIDRLDPQLNAFRTVFAERALAEADQASGRAGAGDDRPLLGVPVAIKDDQGVAGTPLVWGSNAHGGPEAEDSELVRRLRAAGAIVVGVTRTPELTIWPFTESATGGITRNPWDRQHTPGGSSGGAAAAVAAGLVGGATASDGGGSIRIPAACCGLFGLKPQRGRVSLAPKPDAWHGLSVLGFVTRSVADSALLYQAVTDQPYVAAAQRDPGRLRIALSLKVPAPLLAPLNPEWRRAAEETAELLRSLGHEVVERDPEYGVSAVTNFLARYLSGIHDDARAMAHPERLERRTKGMARLGALARPFLGRARAGEAADAARINAIFDDVDVVLGPTMALAPHEVGRYEGRGALWTFSGVARFVPFNLVWNHLGNPAAAVPTGLDAARPAALGAARRAPGRRGDPLRPLEPARGRPPLGRAPPARLVTASPTALRVIAAEAARAAGDLLRERFLAGAERATGTKSSPTDVVSEADLAAEQAIRDVLGARRPDDAILGEEGGQTEGEGLRWIVDPLDGTVNFLFAIPQWCVSIAVHDGAGALAGVIFDPMRDESFAAERDGAATLNGDPLTGSACTTLGTALVATGFAYGAGVREGQAEVAARILPRVRDLRRMGSAALDLAWTAAGRFDAFYERGVQPWDVAAGALICERAGLQVRTLPAQAALPSGILAAPGPLVEDLAALVG